MHVGDTILSEIHCAPADTVVRLPSRRLPAGAVDTHFHVFGPEEDYPYASDRTYTPPDATFDSYLHLASVLGISAAVIVQPSVYGTDNSRTLATLRSELQPMRGVVVLDPAVSDKELGMLHEIGVRGIRINMVFSPEAGFKQARRLADKIRGLGWHIQFLVDISKAENIRRLVDDLNVPVVLDHFGHFDPSLGVEWRGFRDLIGLMTDGKAWVKFSGPYRATERRALPYDDLKPVAEAMLSSAPDQIFWGSDWPHPSIKVPMPNDGALLDMLMDWIGEDELLARLCVKNPRRFYSFSESGSA